MTGTDKMLIAIPSNAKGGLDAERSGHFGSCDCYTLVDIANGSVGSVQVLANPPHEHGGCLRPVQLLADSGVNALVVAGIGARPLAGFAEAGIDVYFDDTMPLVGQVVDAILAGSVDLIDPGFTCGCH